MTQCHAASAVCCDSHVLPRRTCRVCGKEKELSKFSVGFNGRLKSICERCAEAIINSRSGREGRRRCADCGRPTRNYRCGRCWIALRGHVDDAGLDPRFWL